MAHYTFDHWEQDGVNIGSANPITLSPITGPTTVVAIYVPVPTHAVTLDSSPTGVAYIQPAGIAPFSVSVEEGQTITLQVPQEVEA